MKSEKCLLEQESIFLAACEALYRDQYRIAVGPYNNSNLRAVWFYKLLNKCVFPDAITFKANDFIDHMSTYAFLVSSNSPHLGLFVFLKSLLAQRVEFDSVKNYKYGVLFVPGCWHRDDSKAIIQKLANEGCGMANFILFQNGNNQCADLLNNALIANSVSAIIHMAIIAPNLKLKWIWMLSISQLGFHTMFAHCITKEAFTDSAALFYAGQGLEIFYNQIHESNISNNILRRCRSVYLRHLKFTRAACHTMSLFLLRKGIYKDVRILIAKAIWDLRSEWCSQFQVERINY